MAREYHPTRPIDAPALVVRTTGEGRGGVRALHDLGWSDWVRGPITVVEVTGEHLGLLRRPAVLEVGTHLRAAFDRL